MIQDGYSICLNEWALDSNIKNELNLLLIISSLTAEQGYCYANNSYFAELFKIDEVSVSRKIKKLSDCGYISIEYAKQGCQITERKIRLTKMLIHDLQKNQSTINKNVKDNNISIKNINNNNNKTTTKKEFIPPTLEEVKEYFASRNLREDVAIRFYEYYSTGFWKDGKGNKIKNWKQKVIAVWDKPEHKIKTQEQVQNAEKQDKEAESRNMWLKNCSLIKRTICKGKLLLVDIPNELIKRENKDDIYAIKTIQKMKERFLTDEELKILQEYIEILVDLH